MLDAILAGVASLLAVGCIYRSWRVRGEKVVALAGWALTLLSMVGWSRVLGPEFGVTYAIMVFVCLIWMIVFMSMEARGDEIRSAQRPYQSLSFPGAAVLFKHAALFLLSVPATGLLTMMLSVALVLAMPWTLLTKLTVAIFVYPVLWGGLSAWICAQTAPGRPAVAVAGLFVISSLILFI